jgi:hypothetical protein
LGKYCGELAFRIGKRATATNRPASAYHVESLTLNLFIYIVFVFKVEEQRIKSLHEGIFNSRA